MKVWALIKYFRDDIHGDGIYSVDLYADQSDALKVKEKLEKEIMFDEAYYVVDERKVIPCESMNRFTI